MASRYAAVFPLSELINWIYHTRGQRYEELPHSYQMMLFWAGLRGAVGVALAAGITGDNADALRTTILVVVVLTVIIFGGTTARMLEVLGIRVGVEDEDASSDDEGWTSHHGNLALAMGPGSRRFAGQNGRGMFADEGDDIDLHSSGDSPYLTARDLGGRGRRSVLNRVPNSSRPRPGFGRTASRSGFSTNSEESDDGEPLPSANNFQYEDDSPGAQAGGPSQPGMIFRDGQWFTALDEGFLLPLFSNPVTARRHHARKTRKASASVYNGGDSGGASPRGVSLEMTREREREEFEGDEGSENGKNKFPRTFR
jgi:sodium/hydrogen exchanger-like protein 6/7